MKQSILLFAFVIFGNINLQAQITWESTDMDISNNSFGNMHPRLAKDRMGNPLVVWGRMSDKSVMFSRWNGTGFTTPMRLNPSGMDVATASWMGPDIASHGDTVYVIVKRTPEVTDTNYIYIIRSFDGGQNFVAPVRVDMIADSISRFPTIATDPLGNPLVAFMKFNSSFFESRWVVTKSADFGNTFSTDVLASGWDGSTEVCDCCPGSIVSDGNNSAVLYRNNNSNIRDSWMGVSTDNSSTYTAGCALEDNDWMIMACPSTGPDGIIIGDTLHSVFVNGASGDYLIYYSKASLSNVSMNSVNPIASNIAGLTQQNYPRIEKNGNAVGIVWKQVVNGSSELALLFTNDISMGFPQSPDTVDLGDVTNTDVIINNENIFVVWQDDNSNTVKFRMGSYNPSTAKVNKINLEETLSINPNPATNSITIETNFGESLLSVHDLLGKEILNKQISHSENNITIDISSWNKGIYMVTIQLKDKSLIQKIIKE
ncbi:MAG: T9SS type A sorting domain-containing protein [Bacteroidota bacterium]